MSLEKNDTYKVWQPLALSIVLAIGMLFGYKMNEKSEASLISFSDNEAKTVGQVEELIRFIELRYVDSVDREDLIANAMDAVLSDLDPHTVYITPSQIGAVNDEMEGNFRGVGVEIYYIDDTVNVISTVENGPADLAGVKAFDKLISINDSLVAGQGLKFSSIRSMLKGDVGDKIEVRVLDREGISKTVNISIDNIPVSSVEGGVMIDDQTGYIKINRFGSNTYREFMDYVQVLSEKDSMQNIIIDLRDNPGGYLPQATNILSQLFDTKGNLLVYTQGKNDKKLEYKSTGKTFFPIKGISVLIDENSASGSEILAGAIQDWDRGVVVGRRSFGKGLVQEQYALSNGGALRLTVARYYTPTGRSIQRNYDNMDAYYTDYENRYYSGELFSADSIISADSAIYNTMNLSRPMYGGGGITPDIFIPVDSMKFQPLYREVIGELPQYVFRKLSMIDDVESSNIMSYSDSIFSSYIDRKLDLNNELNLEAMYNAIKDEINASLIKYIQGEAEVYKYNLPQDEFVKASLDYFYNIKDLQIMDQQPTALRN